MEGVNLSAAASSLGASDLPPSSLAEASTSPQPTSTELMISLSHIQQLIPLLDYKPGGLSHLLPSLLTPLAPIVMPSADPLAISMGLPGLTQAAQQESMKRYRASVEHAFHVSSELLSRIQDPNTAGSALALAEKLTKQQDPNLRIIRVRKKRRLLTDQEKLIEGQIWAPPPPPPSLTASAVPLNADMNHGISTAAATGDAQQADKSSTSILPSQNTTFDSLDVVVSPPTSSEAIQTYLGALHSYLKETATPIPLENVKMRLFSFAGSSFTLELHIRPLLKAFVQATPVRSPQGEISTVNLASIVAGAWHEDLSENSQSQFPAFNHLSTQIPDRVNKTLSHYTPTTSKSVWIAFKPITEAIARLILSSAQFQSALS